MQYLTLLSLHTITVLPLTTVYFVIEVHSIIPLVLLYHMQMEGNSHITMITVQSSTIVLLRSTVDYHLIKI